jgi:hypothetical protein
MNDTYWLFNWLDSHGINSLPAAEQALSKPSLVEELHEVATQAKEVSPSPLLGKTAILAGRGLDLTGKLDCVVSSCRQRQVDDLFRKAWHYFDRIIVDDVISHQVLHHWDNTSTNPKDSLLSHIEVLLYLRKIGAENLVEFREKPEACTVHLRQHAIEAGLQVILDTANILVPRLAKEAKISVHAQSGGMASFLFKHPKSEIVRSGNLKLGGVKGKPTVAVRKAVVREVLHDYISHLTADITAARSSGVPLGSTIWLHGELLSSASERPIPANVAFNIDLPILQGVSIETLIKVRQDEHESFQRLRDSLRLAINERLDNSSSPQAKEIAEQVRLDIIEPELRRIRDRLTAAEKILAKKTALGVFMGALVTTCGALAGLPLPASIAAGCGAVTTTETSAVTKYLEEKQEASLSDMYFIWKAVKHIDHDL